MDNLTFPHGGNIYELNKKDALDFSANINPLGLSNSVKRKLAEALESLCHYPDPYGRNLTKAIARYWKINEENVLLGNGSVELIYLITYALRPRKALIPAPTFIEYESASRLIGARVQFIKLKENEGYVLNMPRHIDADIIFISNPNNPTANLLIDKDLSPQGDQIFIIDEAFMDFLPDEKEHTLIHRAEKDKGIIVLRSFTKFFALPGLRVGYLAAHKDLIKKLRKHLVPWNVNTLAQLAAREVLMDKEYISETRRFIEKERAFLFNEIKKLKNLQPYPSVTNFIFIKIKDNHVTSSSLKNSLIKREVLIRDCSNFRNLGDKFIRVAVRRHAENLKLLDGLKRAFN